MDTFASTRPTPPSYVARSARLTFRVIAVVLAIVAFAAPLLGDTITLAQSEANQPPVYVVSITGTIDLGLAPYLERVLNDAEDAGSPAVILDINTPGGRLDAVLQMRDTILDANVRTIAFVNRTAFSAGALIAIACQEIYMTPGAVMGAATPIDASGETASDKVVSAVRKTFKSTAEVRHRDPRVAEAMVDPDVVIEGLDGPNELLTLTTDEAVAWGYADGVLSTRDDLLTATGLGDSTTKLTSLSPAEKLVRFITDPVVASLMIAAAILLIIGDLFVGGFGVIGGVGLLLLAVFFWGHNLAGLAGWEDFALVALGLVLIGVEVFVTPGFGVPGILGLIALGAGFWLAMLGGDIRTPAASERAGWSVAAAMIAILIGTVALLSFFPNARRLGGLVLQGQGAIGEPVRARPRGWLGWFGGGAALELGSERAIGQAQPASMEGNIGIALSDLRPSGTAKFGDRQVDVVTRGEYLYGGDAIIVIKDEGYRRVVRRYIPGQEHDAPL
jgi:membrane-bound serine protease (ClpP class)